MSNESRKNSLGLDISALIRFKLCVIVRGKRKNRMRDSHACHELAVLFCEPSIQRVSKAGGIRWTWRAGRILGNNSANLLGWYKKVWDVERTVSGPDVA